MALTEDVKNRLYNWEFKKARAYLDHQMELGEVYPSTEEIDTITALSVTFGSPGWFDGTMSDIVRSALRSVGVFDQD